MLGALGILSCVFLVEGLDQQKHKSRTSDKLMYEGRVAPPLSSQEAVNSILGKLPELDSASSSMLESSRMSDSSSGIFFKYSGIYIDGIYFTTLESFVLILSLTLLMKLPLVFSASAVAASLLIVLMMRAV